MSQGIVFKQSYKSRNLPSTPILNRKHLVYIATRPGAAHNPGCSFGLWGRLPGGMAPENINDLEAAKKVVTKASKVHTLQRAIISVDDEAAKRHGLYKRSTWENLVNKKINVLAELMGIKEKDLCFFASMHYAKGHPHVHILYWDNSDAVHQEHIPQERFEILAEKVRAAFNKEIFREEIYQALDDKRESSNIIRLKLKAMLEEVNLAEALNLSHVSQTVQSQLMASFAELAATAPATGSLKYAYMKGEYKEKLDAFVEDILKISDFRKEIKLYDAAVMDVSRLDGNGEAQQKFELGKAREALKKGLGNIVLETISDFRKELTQDAPTERSDLQIVLQGTTSMLLKANPGYQELLNQMPKLRTPTGELLKNEAFRQALSKLTGQICEDVRITSRVYGYVKANNGGQSKEGVKEQMKDIYAETKKSVFSMAINQLRADAGYPEQAQADVVTNLLIRLLGDASRSRGQRQAQRDLLRHRELSKTAQRDRKVQQEQAGSWPGPEL